jgi:hypothetical protein
VNGTPGVTDYEVAQAAYRAAVKRWPNAKIKVRNRAMSHRAELGRTENCRLIASVGDRAFTLCFPSTGRTPTGRHRTRPQIRASDRDHL